MKRLLGSDLLYNRYAFDDRYTLYGYRFDELYRKHSFLWHMPLIGLEGRTSSRGLNAGLNARASRLHPGQGLPLKKAKNREMSFP